MAVKLAVTFAFLAIVLMLTWQSNATVVRRDAPTEKPSDATQAIDEAIQNMKAGLDKIMKNIQENELFQNVSNTLKQFGEQVEAQGKQLVEKIQNVGQVSSDSQAKGAAPVPASST